MCDSGTCFLIGFAVPILILFTQFSFKKKDCYEITSTILSLKGNATLKRIVPLSNEL